VNKQQTSEYYSSHPNAIWVTLFVVALCYFLFATTLTGVNVALPSIATEYTASAVLLSWVPTAYVLTNAILILPFGRLADNFGRKQLFFSGVIIFGVASYLVTLAADLYWLIGFRVLQAVGASMFQATGMAIVTAVFPVAKRGFALGICGSSIYLGMSTGPFLAGWLTEVFGWRSVFYFQLPFSVLIIGLIIFWLKGEWRNNERLHFDWLGLLLLAASLSCLLLGVSGLAEFSALLLIAAGIAAGIAFVFCQLTVDHPLLRLREIAKNHVFRNSMIILLIMYAAAYPLTFVLSLYLQLLLGMTPQEAGTLLVTASVVMAVTAPLAGRMSDRIVPQKLVVIGSSFAALGYFVLYWLDLQTSVFQVVIGLSLIGLGMGLLGSPNQNAALSSVADDRLGSASAVISLGRNLGNITGLGVALSLMAIFVGKQDIAPANFDQFLLMVRYTFLFSCGCALLAVLVTFRNLRRNATNAGD
jgi:EmrB/QacA subfamily drug resistance transporter